MSIRKDYTLRPNALKKFQNEDNILIEEFYQTLLQELRGDIEEYPESIEKSIQLYMHHLGLRRAKSEDLRRWMVLNVLDFDEKFKDENSYINTDGEGTIDAEEYSKLICNIVIHSLAWAGQVHIDHNSNITMSKVGRDYLDKRVEKDKEEEEDKK